MANVIGMIPVLLGSTRIPDKNILLLNGRVLCSYTIEACRKSDAFSDIYLNSENEIFSDIAKSQKVKFYHRNPENGGTRCRQKNKSRDCKGNRCVINEHYLYDFMKNLNCDYLFQVNSTSPLLRPETISVFVNKLVHENYDCLFAIRQLKAETFFQGQPITFDRNRKQPSQELEPLNIICWAIAGWKCDTFVSVYEQDDIMAHSPVFSGRLGLFPVDEREALDIDEWSTLNIIEKYLASDEIAVKKEWTYVDGRTITEE
jgi:CMP-N-acetylneuraminic acid synthetase